jgi:hypothetical protein
MAKKKAAAPKVAFEVGKTYLLRGVTMYQIGTVVGITPTELLLSPAAWVADTGRFNAALKSGVLAEVEPYPTETLPAGVNRGALSDWCTWPHGVPTEVK